MRLRLPVGVIALFPLLVVSAQQQQHQQQHYGKPPKPSSQPQPPSWPSDLTLQELSARHFHDTLPSLANPLDASALATLAPARGGPRPTPRAVRAPPARLLYSGLSHPQLEARSLQDWEVEDFVLMATVDGSLHAHDRYTGAERWALQVPNPMIETIYHRENQTRNQLELDIQPEDDYLWIIEPTRDGELYVYNQGPKGGLRKLGFTVKTLVDETPYSGMSPPVTYTARKETTLYTVDSRTGKVLRSFSSRGPLSPTKKCRSVTDPNSTAIDDSEDCDPDPTGTLTLGRISYIVSVQNTETGDAVCTIKYSEWTPNHRDADLQEQYHKAMDNNHIYTLHDGMVISYDHGDQDSQKFIRVFPTPVARVFDVARRSGEDGTDESSLVILSQPRVPPIGTSLAMQASNDNVYVGCTETGGWFAMSEAAYPMVTKGAKQAQVYTKDYTTKGKPLMSLTLPQLNAALVGVHKVRNINGLPSVNILPVPGLPPHPGHPKGNYGELMKYGEPHHHGPFKHSVILRTTYDNWADVLVVLILTLVFLFFYFNLAEIKEFLRKSLEVKQGFVQLGQPIPEGSPRVTQPLDNDLGEAVVDDLRNLKEKPEDERLPSETLVSQPESSSRHSQVSDPSLSPTALPDTPLQPPSDRAETISPAASSSLSGGSTPAQSRKSASRERSPLSVGKHSPTPSNTTSVGPANVRILVPTESGDTTVAPDAPLHQETSSNPVLSDKPPEKPKKKAHRGRRGGQAHKRGRRQQAQESGSPSNATSATTGDLPLGDSLSQLSVPSTGSQSPSTLDSTKGVQVGSLRVFDSQILGLGSHGTIVCKGIFDGREVAVKRMLQEFYDVAAREVNLLQESDDHTNVIRYYCREQTDDFLFIALELCPANLQQIVENPAAYPDVVPDGVLDRRDMLRQITAGVKYLHSLKIVHRDLKPQNILVAAPKKVRVSGGKATMRLMISDFGLCKRLEDEQSSFRATTANAAGTVGWRAPELLRGDEKASTFSQASTGGSRTRSQRDVSSQDTNETYRRATRAIDIFSLGCIFYYILTGGGHPYDKDGKYMREANILMGQYDLEDLRLIAADSYEAEDLIKSMLHQDPKERPDPATILNHPFFWSANDRLNFLCDVSDHFEFEPRDPPSPSLQALQAIADTVMPGHDFLKLLPALFKESLGKQRKYQGHQMLDLLRALRNKRNHYNDMPEPLKESIGGLPDGYLFFWTSRFPPLLMECHKLIRQIGVMENDRFKGYFVRPE